ncbi:MAG: hypothetical protein ACREJN_14990 [Nitrospiraceae bacterium]
MNQKEILESAIIDELAQVGPCRIDVLYERLPYYSWSQIHVVVDRLMQEGTIVRKHPIRSLNLVSLAPHHPDQPRDAA